jgi:hypothetical protein
MLSDYVKHTTIYNFLKQLSIGQSIVIDMTGVQLPAEALMGLFLFAVVSRPSLGSIQPPIQWVSDLFPQG